MAKFVVGQPLATKESAVVVDAGLPAGRHRFQLEVLTDTGQKSPPAVAVVAVQASTVLAVVSPAVAPTLTPVVSPSPVLSPATTPGDVPVASTLPKTVSLSTTPRTVTPRKTRKKKG